MTDKEIIIDGVNVAECQHYLDKKGLHTKHNGRCLLFDCKCHEIDINTEEQCYYKQLQRKTRECEELKEWKNEAVRLWNRTCRCEYLDEENAICKETHKECIGIVNCRDRYKQALEKIKELVTITSQMEHSCATETIFEIINEVKNAR